MTYPMGLNTADEIVAAGSGKGDTHNNKYYLYRPNNLYWLLSLGSYSNNRVYMFCIDRGGELVNYSATAADTGVAPVINISKEYAEKMIGEGTIENPYREK